MDNFVMMETSLTTMVAPVCARLNRDGVAAARIKSITKAFALKIPQLHIVETELSKTVKLVMMGSL